MQDQILRALRAGQNVMLVAPSTEGKSYFEMNILKPYLESHGSIVQYFPDMNQDLSTIEPEALVILDEFEVLEDQAYLEQLHPEERPYYVDSYLEKVHQWLAKAKAIPNQRIFIVSRDVEEIEHFLTLHDFSFAQPVTVMAFNRQHG